MAEQMDWRRAAARVASWSAISPSMSARRSAASISATSTMPTWWRSSARPASSGRCCCSAARNDSARRLSRLRPPLRRPAGSAFAATLLPARPSRDLRGRQRAREAGKRRLAARRPELAHRSLSSAGARACSPTCTPSRCRRRARRHALCQRHRRLRGAAAGAQGEDRRQEGAAQPRPAVPQSLPRGKRRGDGGRAAQDPRRRPSAGPHASRAEAARPVPGRRMGLVHRRHGARRARISTTSCCST